MKLGFEDAVEVLGCADGDQGVGVCEGGEDADFVGVLECCQKDQYILVGKIFMVSVHARTAMIAEIGRVVVGVDWRSRLGDVKDQERT